MDAPEGNQALPRKRYRLPTYVYYLVFIASGFAGLLYESIWARYLKLFLGHDAYAQTLVLAIFLFGLALGSALASLYAERIKSPLLAYAIVEAVVGLIGIYFHDIFTLAISWAYDSVLPAIGIGAGNVLFRWGLATVLILPQTILLGTTFPLMSSGVMRLQPEKSGQTISWLYFSNSIGAAVGVLASGFFLVEWIGLPGTVITAGFLSAAAAGVVWLMHHLADNAGSVQRRGLAGAGSLDRTILAVAALTGLASFIYEIVWIRMLTLLIGQSSHAFELMLSSFILGLALGGFWIRKYIDSLKAPMATLAVVQLLMGIFAISTIFLYEGLFEIVDIVNRGVRRTPENYGSYNIFRYGVAMLVMLPSTICAGMTLPLMTNHLFRSGGGERVIGKVYAANTLGSIAGVVLAVHLLMPALGLKNAIIVGGAIDLALGCWLSWRFAKALLPKLAAWTTASLGVSIATPPPDPNVVYKIPGSALYHKDSITASVDIGHIDGEKARKRTLVVNGLVQSGMAVTGYEEELAPLGGGSDEIVNATLAAIPLSFRPDAKLAANVGFGSGLTSHTLLHSKRLERLDTIEIEPAVIEAGKFFLPKISKVYEDPRHHIQIDDARSFLASRQAKGYDIIISEPAQVWRKGIASLFSKEYYQFVSQNLGTKGIFVQWIQLWALSPEMAASIIIALNEEFGDFRIFQIGENLIVVASRKGENLPKLSGEFLEDQETRDFMHPLIRHVDDIGVLSAGNSKAMMPFFRGMGVPGNSDYFPYLDSQAGKIRFLGSSFDPLILHTMAGFPFLNMLGGLTARSGEQEITGAGSRYAVEAKRADNILNAHNPLRGQDLYKAIPNATQAGLIDGLYEGCPQTPDDWLLWLGGIRYFALFTYPYSTTAKVEAYWSAILDRCLGEAPQDVANLANFYRSLGLWDYNGIARTAETLQISQQATGHEKVIVYATAVAYINLNQPENALLWLKKIPDSKNDTSNIKARLEAETRNIIQAAAYNAVSRGRL